MAINEYRVLAVVPARSGSKGLPGKNIRSLQGKPLLSYPLIAARNSRYVDDVIISTDSIEYARIAQDYGATFKGLRPKNIADDSSQRSDVILYEIDKNPGFDILLYLEPTSPLTDSNDIDNALEAFVSNSQAQALVSICFQHAFHPSYAVSRAENAIISPNVHNKFDEVPINRQELSKVYFFDGSLYISNIDYFKHKKEFLHEYTMGYEMPLDKALEVDNAMDLKFAEVILNEQQ